MVKKLAWDVWDLVSLTEVLFRTRVNFTVYLPLRLSVPPDKVALLYTKQLTEQGIQSRCLLSQITFQNFCIVFLVVSRGITGVYWEPLHVTFSLIQLAGGVLDVRPPAHT